MNSKVNLAFHKESIEHFDLERRKVFAVPLHRGVFQDNEVFIQETSTKLLSN